MALALSVMNPGFEGSAVSAQGVSCFEAQRAWIRLGGRSGGARLAVAPSLEGRHFREACDGLPTLRAAILAVGQPRRVVDEVAAQLGEWLGEAPFSQAMVTTAEVLFSGAAPQPGSLQVGILPAVLEAAFCHQERTRFEGEGGRSADQRVTAIATVGGG